MIRSPNIFDYIQLYMDGLDRILACEPTGCGMEYGKRYSSMFLSCNNIWLLVPASLAAPSLPVLLWAVATFYWGPYRGLGPYRTVPVPVPYRTPFTVPVTLPTPAAQWTPPPRAERPQLLLLLSMMLLLLLLYVIVWAQPLVEENGS